LHASLKLCHPGLGEISVRQAGRCRCRRRDEHSLVPDRPVECPPVALFGRPVGRDGERDQAVRHCHRLPCAGARHRTHIEEVDAADQRLQRLLRRSGVIGGRVQVERITDVLARHVDSDHYPDARLPIVRIRVVGHIGGQPADLYLALLLDRQIGELVPACADGRVRLLGGRHVRVRVQAEQRAGRFVAGEQSLAIRRETRTNPVRWILEVDAISQVRVAAQGRVQPFVADFDDRFAQVVDAGHVLGYKADRIAARRRGHLLEGNGLRVHQRERLAQAGTGQFVVRVQRQPLRLERVAGCHADLEGLEIAAGRLVQPPQRGRLSPCQIEEKLSLQRRIAAGGRVQTVDQRLVRVVAIGDQQRVGRGRPVGEHRHLSFPDEGALRHAVRPVNDVRAAGGRRARHKVVIVQHDTLILALEVGHRVADAQDVSPGHFQRHHRRLVDACHVRVRAEDINARRGLNGRRCRPVKDIEELHPASQRSGRLKGVTLVVRAQFVRFPSGREVD